MTGANTERTLRVEVVGREEHCPSCSSSLWWLVAVQPAYRPDAGELIPVDYPEVIDLAKEVLAEQPDLADQLAPRPAWQRGRGFNPNRCRCGYQADWHYFEGVVERAVYGEGICITEARIPVTWWRSVRDTERMVWIL